MKHVKTFAFLIVVALSIFGATKITLQSPIVERQEAKQSGLPDFQLSKNIDESEAYDDLLIKLAESK